MAEVLPLIKHRLRTCMNTLLTKNRKIRNYAEIVKDITPRYFHGNVRAQYGKIMTTKDVEERRTKIANYAF